MNTLTDYYQGLGQPMPTINKRAELYKQYGFHDPYSGTIQQNTALLGKLQAPKTPAHSQASGAGGTMTTINPDKIPEVPSSPIQGASPFTVTMPPVLSSTDFAKMFSDPTTKASIDKQLITNQLLQQDYLKTLTPTATETELSKNISDLYGKLDTMATQAKQAQFDIGQQKIPAWAQIGQANTIERQAQIAQQPILDQITSKQRQLGYETQVRQGLMDKAKSALGFGQAEVDRLQKVADNHYQMEKDYLTYAHQLQTEQRQALSDILTKFAGVDVSHLTSDQQQALTGIATQFGLDPQAVIQGISLQHSGLQIQAIKDNLATARAWQQKYPDAKITSSDLNAIANGDPTAIDKVNNKVEGSKLYQAEITKTTGQAQKVLIDIAGLGSTASQSPDIKPESSVQDKIKALTSGSPVQGYNQGTLYNAAIFDMIGAPTIIVGGMGSAKMRAAIGNKEADVMKAFGLTPFDVSVAKSEYKNLTAQNAKVLQTAAYNKIYTGTAKDNLDLALSQSDAVARSNAKFANRYLQWAQGEFTPAGPLAKFETYIYTASREYAKVTSGGAMSAQGLTDSAQKEASKLLNAAQSPEAFAQVIEAMKNDMDNVNNNFDSQLSSFAPSISKLLGIDTGAGVQQNQQGNSGGMLTSPDGTQEVNISDLTAAQIQEAKKAGWK